MSRIRADRYTNREGTGAPTFSDGVNVVGVTSMSGDLAVTNGTITGPSQLTISGITSSISDTAVDVFVYDTRKDSDGGAWRKRTQNTSWYNETLGTATRGSRKEFPAVAVIVAETSKVTIYDGDDPDLPMWMVFNQGGSYVTSNNLIGTTSGTNSAISSLNGILSLTTGNEALYLIKFISDTSHRITNSADREYLGGIGERNSGKGLSSSNSTNYIVNANCNDVAMTVLPNAPIDDATGLPVPTIAVATDGGVSIIKDDGSVVDKATTSEGASMIAFTDVDKLIAKNTDVNYIGIFDDIITDQSSTYIGNILDATFSYDGVFESDPRYNYPNPTGKVNNNADVVNLKDKTFAFGVNEGSSVSTSNGINILQYTTGSDTDNNGILVGVTTSYNTGWMHGNIQIATLSDTDATNQTGGTIADRSVNSNSLNVTGTITRTAVATGADLVAYSGFSASNRLIDSSFTVDFGNPVTISIAFWQKITDTSDYSYGVSLADGGSIKGGISNGPDSVSYTGEVYFNMGSETLFSGVTVNDGLWHCVVGSIDKNDKKLYIDGRLVSSTIINDYNMSGIDEIFVGSFDTQYHHLGSLSLMRVSKAVPSPEQVKKMYEDEKYLFQENSQATLYGSSDTVTALGYDDTTDLLYAGTSAGRSEFQGLRRINNTTVDITTAISASNELVAEQ